MSKKPRVRFCWECMTQLWGNKYVEMEIEGYVRILHKKCAENILNKCRDPHDYFYPEEFDEYWKGWEEECQ